MTARALAPALAFFAVAACGGGGRIETEDFLLVHRRAGEGRPAVTALAFEADGRHLVVGDYRGGLERFDGSDGTSTALPGSSDPGEILALAWRGGAPLPIARSAASLGWGRLSGALGTRDGACVGWSALSRQLWSRPASLSGEPHGICVSDLSVAAAAIAGDRLLVIHGRAPEAATLECRDLATLQVAWSQALPHPARALCALPERDRIVIADDAGLELRVLADGSPAGRIDAAPTAGALCSLHDGRRVLLVTGDDVALLRLAEPPQIVPGFAAHRGGVTAVAVSDDGSLLATGGARGDLLVLRILPDARPSIPRVDAASMGAAP